MAARIVSRAQTTGNCFAAKHGRKPTRSGGLAHELMLVLIESVKLQSHYAALLNMHDGGERMQFSCPAEWIERLKVCGTIPKSEATR